MQPIRARRSGFTLIELLVVIVIIGLLTSVATASYLRAQQNARDNARKADLQALAAAVESYYSVNKRFPGKTDLQAAVGTTSLPGNDYNGQLQGCEYVATNAPMRPVAYFYTPASVQCSSITVTGSGSGYYNKADYLPAGTWIPGLGTYLNPPPSEKRYAMPSLGDMLTAADVRTYAYRHLDGGFMVYGRLEGAMPSDGNYMATGAPITDQPMLTGGTSVPVSSASANLYVIRQ